MSRAQLKSLTCKAVQGAEASLLQTVVQELNATQLGTPSPRRPQISNRQAVEQVGHEQSMAMALTSKAVHRRGGQRRVFRSQLRSLYRGSSTRACAFCLQVRVS